MASSGKLAGLRLTRPGLYFYKRQYRPVKANQIDLTFYARRTEVAADHDVAMAPQIPIGEGLAAHTHQMSRLPAFSPSEGGDCAAKPFLAAQSTSPKMKLEKMTHSLCPREISAAPETFSIRFLNQ